MEKRASIGVRVPGWNSFALVYLETSSVMTSSPKAPEPLAWGLRSGMRSRSKWASFSTNATSWSMRGPSGPTLSEFASDSRGAPACVVDVLVESCWAVGSNAVTVFPPELGDMTGR